MMLKKAKHDVMYSLIITYVILNIQSNNGVWQG